MKHLGNLLSFIAAFCTLMSAGAATRSEHRLLQPNSQFLSSETDREVKVRHIESNMPVIKNEKTETKKYPVKIKLQYGPEYELDALYYVNATEWIDSYDMDWDEDNDIVTLMLPEGLNDIIVRFQHTLYIGQENEAWYSLGFSYYIIEDVVVGEMMPELTADASECRSIPMQFTLPDGSPVKLSTIKWTGEGFEPLTEGNIAVASNESSIYNSKYDVKYRFTNIFPDIPDKVEGYDYDPWDFWQVQVNKVSDRWNFYMDVIFIDKNKNYSNAGIILDPTTEKVEIKQSDYYSIPWNFTDNSEYPTKGVSIHTNYSNNNFNTSPLGVVFDMMTEGIPGLYATNLDFRKNPKTPKPYLYFNVKNGYNAYQDEDMDIRIKGLSSPQMLLDEDKWICQPATTVFASIPMEEDPNEREYYDEEYWGNPTANYHPGQLICKLGDTTPYMVSFLYLDLNHDIDAPDFILPENMIIDLSGTDRKSWDTPVSTVWFNGKEVKNEETDLYEFLYSWNINEKGKGTIEYRLTNTLNPTPTNQPESKNIVSIVSDQTKEDLYPPTITCLQPRTSTDEINNVFTKPSDGSFRMFAGDTTNKWQWANWGDSENPFYVAYQWREINPDVTAKVEYSPYGKENWTELDAKQDTEAYSKALGNLYNISLETVDQKSDNGWFDLRISLTDASGNSQTQIISPAFKITDLTGIDSLTPEDASTPVYYDLTGMRIQKPQKGELVIQVRNGKAEKLIFQK